MSIPNERISYLWQQFANKKATEQELEELFSILNEGKQDEDSRIYLQQMIKDSPPTSVDKNKWEPILQFILRSDKNAEPVQKVYSIKRVWWAAAAVLVIALGSYFLFFNKQKTEIAKTQAERFKNDVAPGGNKAILTLGNGKQIILDSAHNGTLALQGKTKIVKTDSAKLAYDISNEKPTEIVYNVLTTPNAAQYQLRLPDGTLVWLNAASSIKYPTAFIGKERTVEITGEAYFEVVHNSKQPFFVKAGNETVEDIGTHFNVNAYSDEPNIKTTLLEGAVNVKVGEQSLALEPGQQAYVDKTGKIIKEEHADIEAIMGWKNGLFVLHSADLAAMMREASRWYDVSVEYQKQVSTRFNGEVSRKTPLSDLLKAMELSGEVKFGIEGHKVIVLK